MQTPTLSPTPADIWNDPSTWQFVTTIAVTGLVIAIFACLTPIVIELINRRRQRRSEKELATDSDAGSYPAPVIENATRYYVRPKCSNVDPAQEAEIRNVIPTSEYLFKYVDDFLEGAPRMKIGDGPIRHLIVLADSGMGKTSFVLNYFAYNKKKSLRNRKRLAIIHLGSNDALEKIAAITNKGETDLFLDALDEDPKAVGAPHAHHTRLMEIFRACPAFKHVVITCRTQFFPRDDEIPKSTGIIDLGPRSAGEGGHYKLWKVYLNPLTDDQVDEYLRKRYPGFFNREVREKASNTVKKIPLLSVRPMLLTYIPDLLESNRPIDDTYQLYEVMVEKWLEREKDWVGDTEKLREFSEEVAVDIFMKSKQRGGEKIPREALFDIAQKKGINIEYWKLTGRSLLNRDSEGNYKFSHRSIMEYLFIKRYLAGDQRCWTLSLPEYNVPYILLYWTDFMKLFLVEQLTFNYYEAKTEKPRAHDITINDSFDGADLSIFDFTSYLKEKFSIPQDEVLRIRFTARSYSSVAFSGSSLPLVEFESLEMRLVYFDLTKAEQLIFSCDVLEDVTMISATVEDLVFHSNSTVEVAMEGIRLNRLIAYNTNLSKVSGLEEAILEELIIDTNSPLPARLGKLVPWRVTDKELQATLNKKSFRALIYERWETIKRRSRGDF